MGSVVLAGATSGSTTLTPVDAVTATITMPSATGTLATLSTPSFTTGIAVGGATAQAGGIAFPATQVSVSNANTLDDYEEGTFTPTITMGTSGTATLDSSANTWSYTKVGRLVNITGWASISSVSSPIGEMIINNLPFSSAAGTEFSARAAGSVVLQDSGAGMVGVAVVTIAASSSTLNIRKTTAGVVAGFAAGDIIASTNFYVGITYIAET